jgi:hypothetical protein
MKKNLKIFGVVLAASLASTSFALAVEPIGDAPRKWSQPSYDEAPDAPLTKAPELEGFPTIPEDNDAALFDGDGRPLVPRSAPSR